MSVFDPNTDNLEEWATKLAKEVCDGMRSEYPSIDNSFDAIKNNLIKILKIKGK